MVSSKEVGNHLLASSDQCLNWLLKAQMAKQWLSKSISNLSWNEDISFSSNLQMKIEFYSEFWQIIKWKMDKLNEFACCWLFWLSEVCQLSQMNSASLRNDVPFCAHDWFLLMKSIEKSISSITGFKAPTLFLSVWQPFWAKHGSQAEKKH